MIFCNDYPRLHAASIPPVLSRCIATVAMLVLVLAGWPAPSQAQSRSVLSLSGPVDSADLAPVLEYIIDPKWEMTVSELTSPASAGWQPVTGAAVDFGYTSARIWLRLKVVNRTADISDWRLFIHANFWPTLQAWRLGQDGSMATLIDLQPDSPYSARTIPYPQTVAPFALAPGETATLIMAYSSQGSSRTAISIQTADSFAALATSSIAKTFTFYGMILALVAITSIALVVLRQGLHVIYAGYVVSLFLYIAHIDGNTFQYLWPQSPGFNNMASVLFGAGAMIFGALFAIVYLQTRRFHPVMHRVLIAAVVTVLGVVIGLWTYDPQLLKKMMVIMLSLNALVILSSAIVAALQRYQEVKYYLFAWIMALTPAVLFTARHIFAFESGLIATYDAVRIALVFDAYMMGFATIDQLRRSREQALADSLAMAKRNLLLGERLAVLDQNYEQLSTRARLREEDVMDAVHDLRQPMHALRLSMRQRFADGSQNKDTGQIEAALSYMEQLVAGRLAASSAAETSGGAAEETTPPAAPDRADQRREPGLHDVLRGVAEMFEPEAVAKGLELKLRLAAPDGPVEAYALMRALANLVSNAIKYTRNGRVLIALRSHGSGWRVEVHDTGPGLDAAEFAQALGRSARLPRDRAEIEGSGLGLAIVQEIVAAQGWEMTPCSHRKTGASIRLEIPAISNSAGHRTDA